MKSTRVKKLASTLGVGSLLLGGAVMAAPAASAAPAVTTTATASTSTAAESLQAAGPRTALVSAWYRQFLFRDAAEDPGSQYWVVQLRTTPPAEVLAQILTSPEHVATTVEVYYLAYLDRSTSGDGGARYWIDGVLAGSFPLEWVEQNVLASPEYLARTGADGGVVQAWYLDVLDRNVYRPGEIAYWQDRLRQTSSLQVLRELWYSPEAVNGRVEFAYAISLGRAPNAGELAYWYGPEVDSDARVRIAIASSPEALAFALDSSA